METSVPEMGGVGQKRQEMGNLTSSGRGACLVGLKALIKGENVFKEEKIGRGKPTVAGFSRNRETVRERNRAGGSRLSTQHAPQKREIKRKVLPRRLSTAAMSANKRKEREKGTDQSRLRLWGGAMKT